VLCGPLRVRDLELRCWFGGIGTADDFFWS
jgi:hypothetical protein